VTPDRAQQVADAWRSGLARNLTTKDLARELGINVGTLYNWRRDAEAALGVKLDTSTAAPGVAGRERAKAVLAARLPPLPEPNQRTVAPILGTADVQNCRQISESADVSEQVNPEPVAPQRVANEPSTTRDVVAEDAELRSLRREVKELRKVSADLAAIQRIIGRIDASIATDAPAWTREAPKGGRLVHGIPSLMLSDLHFGEVVFANQVNGVNQYSTEIAKRRLDRVVKGSIRLLRQTLAPGEFGGMVVILGGDMAEGVIHDEIRDTVDETVMQAVITLHDELVPHLKTLCDEFGRLHVPCVAGNHGRLDRKPRQKNGPALNFDWLLYQFIARTIGADAKYRDRITFQIPEGYECCYRVHGLRYMLTHGDAFKGGNGITGPLLPWMRGNLKASKAYSAMGMPYDVMVMGHWHQLRYLRSIIVNGSLVGYNEYAAKNHFDFEVPQQALWLTHPTRGLTFQEAVFAEDATPPAETAWIEVPRAAA
jgi:transposase-like protein/predicted phosphodiesterase